MNGEEKITKTIEEDSKNERPLEIKFLGTRGLVEESSPSHFHHTSLLISDGEQKVLLDCGETFVGKELPEIDAIWISHGHPDHIGGLAGREISVPIFCTKETKEFLPKDLQASDVRVVPEKGTFDLLKWKAQTFPVAHSIKAPTTGLILYIDEMRIAFPSDILFIPQREKILDGVDIFIADGSTLEKSIARKDKETGELFGHAALRHQLGWCEELGIPKVYVIHFGKEAIEKGDDELEEWLSETAEEVATSVEAEIAWDEKEVKIEEDELAEMTEIESSETQLVKVPSLSRFPAPFRVFGSIGAHLPQLILFVPKHKNRIEGCAGGGEFIWRLPPPEGREIINDKNPIVAWLHRKIKNLTDDEIKALRRRKWIKDENHFNKLQQDLKNNKLSGLDLLYAWIYLTKCTPHRDKGIPNRFFHSKRGEERIWTPFEKWRERYRNVEIMEEDILTQLSKWGEDTFIFLDPSYLGYDKYYAEGSVMQVEDLKKAFGIMEKARAKIMLIGYKLFPIASEFKLYKTRIKKHVGYSDWGGEHVRPWRYLDIVTNYNFRAKNFERYEIDENLFEVDEILNFADEPLIKKLKDYDPSILSDAVLSDDWRIVTAWWSTLKEGKPFKYTEDEVFDVARKILNEILKREKITLHFEDMTNAAKDLTLKILESEVKQGLYLVPPHGEMIREGKKTAIIKSKPFGVKGFYLLCEGDRVLGYIRLKDRYDGNPYPKRISLDEFRKLRNEHQISDEERKAWWGDTGWLYYYPIREFIPLPEPKRYKFKKGVQTFIREVEFLSAVNSFDISSINPEFLAGLTVNEIIHIHAELHRTYWKIKGKGAIEPIVNAHAFLVDEMRRRSMDVRALDELDRLSERFETPLAKEEGNIIYLNDVLKYFQKQVILSDPDVILVGSLAINGRGHDIDLLLRGRPDRVREFRLVQMFPPELRNKVHFIYDGEGAFTNYIPIYRRMMIAYPSYQIQPMQKEELPDEAEFKIKLMKPFTPLKTATGYHISEFFSREPLWTLWAQPHIEMSGSVLVEPKYDGIRFVIHKDGNDVAIFTEDAKRDRAKIFPEIVEEVRALPVKQTILDCEFVWWKEGAPITRQKMMHFVVGKEPLRGEDIHVNVFGILWNDDGSLQMKTEIERKRALEKILPKPLKFLKPTVYQVVKNRKDFDEAISWAEGFIGSEGAMLKDPQAFYIKERTADWAKLKSVREIKVQSIGRRKIPAARPAGEKWTRQEALKNLPMLMKKSDTFVFRVAFLGEKKELIPFEARKKLTPKDLRIDWDEERQEWIGTEDLQVWEMGLGFENRKLGEYAYANTYASAILPYPKIGDILTVAPIALERWLGDDDKEHYSWMFPIVRDLDLARTKPDDKAFVDSIVALTAAKFKAKEAKTKAELSFEEWATSPRAELLMDALQSAEELVDLKILKMPELSAEQKSYIERWGTKLSLDDLHGANLLNLPKNFYVIVEHFRGKSVHKDFRVKMNEHLEGFTITDQRLGFLKEDVDSFEQAKSYVEQRDSGRLYPEAPPAKHVFAIPKAKQPLVWLRVVKDIFPPGSVGATRFEEGVFYARDWGVLWQGVQKPYFKEFFLRGKNFSGTLVFRLLTARPEWEKVPEEGLHWEAFFTRQDSPPYLLSRRGRERADYIPPEGVSGIPPEFENYIENKYPDLVWWNGKEESRKKILTKMNRVFNL